MHHQLVVVVKVIAPSNDAPLLLSAVVLLAETKFPRELERLHLIQVDINFQHVVFIEVRVYIPLSF